MSDTGDLSRPSFVSGDDSGIFGTWSPPSPEAQRRAARVAALHSTSVEDCHVLLTALGLTFKPEDVRSYYADLRSIV